MGKTEQQKRFEAIGDRAERLYEQYPDGIYVFESTRLGFEGFQLGEASALERAAKRCEEMVHDVYDQGDMFAEAIRALAQEVGK